MHVVNQRTKESIRSHISLIVFVFLGLVLFPTPPFARTAPHVVPAIKAHTSSETPQARYQTSKTRLAILLTSDPSTPNRSNWLLLANQFGTLYTQNRQSEIGPASLYMQARTYHLMHARFHLAQDAESARKTYLKVADLFPGHSLSDDALFKAAMLTGPGEKNTPTAESLYTQIVNQYPQGDYVHRAKSRLQLTPKKLVEAQKPPTPIATTTGTVQQKKELPHKGKYAPVGQFKFWSSGQYSRFVVAAKETITYDIKQNHNSLLLDLHHSTIDPALCGVQQFEQGLLREVQTQDDRKGTVRFQFTLHPFDEYKVFTLNNPFRVILDVYGHSGTVTVAENGAKIQEPQPIKVVVASKTRADGVVPVLSDYKKTSTTAAVPHIKTHREPLSLAQQLGLGVKTIVIDPGHGGKDPGAMAFGLKEKDIVLRVSKKLGKILSETFNYQVVLTRTKDVYIPLEKRTAIANAKKADLFVSIHVNAHPNQSNSGIETYFLNLATDADAMRVAALENASSTHSIGELQDILSSLMNNSKIDESSRLARFVQTNLINGFKSSYKPRDLGVKQAPFYVLIGAEMPAILAELSFITNPKEAQLLQDDRHLEKIAQQLAGGIVAYIDHHRAAASYTFLP